MRYTLFLKSLICISISGGVLHSTVVLSKRWLWTLAFPGALFGACAVVDIERTLFLHVHLDSIVTSMDTLVFQ